jgi:peptidoglycan/xylan/chitin deacetylase (PgdA/CDA1 family)
MFGRITLKRAIKKTGGWAAILTAPFVGHAESPKGCILVYHRVAELGFIDPHVDDWNVPPKIFERQVASLAAIAEFVPLIDLPAKLARSPHSKPLVSLTFDDGYANFCTQALPVLKQHNVPATVFVITNCIGQAEPFPFEQWSLKNRNRVLPDTWRPMNWQEIETCLASGLVTIGSHSHRHLSGHECSQQNFIAEAEESRHVLLSRLGKAQARAYAYPYGSTRLGHVTSGYVKAVQEAGYELAVTTDLGLVHSTNNRYLLPRVEAHGSDTPAVMRAKVRGGLLPYHVINKLRTAEPKA